MSFREYQIGKCLVRNLEICFYLPAFFCPCPQVALTNAHFFSLVVALRLWAKWGADRVNLEAKPKKMSLGSGLRTLWNWSEFDITSTSFPNPLVTMYSLTTLKEMKAKNKWLSSSDPHQVTFYLIYIRHFDILSDILSDVYSDILSDILPGILSDNLPGVYFGILSGI